MPTPPHTARAALASRGYEIANVFIDDLYDHAKREHVSEDKWHEFIRYEIPSPADTPCASDDEDDHAGGAAAVGSGGASSLSLAESAPAACPGFQAALGGGGRSPKRSRHAHFTGRGGFGRLGAMTLRTRASTNAILRRMPSHVDLVHEEGDLDLVHEEGEGGGNGDRVHAVGVNGGVGRLRVPREAERPRPAPHAANVAATHAPASAGIHPRPPLLEFASGPGRQTQLHLTARIEDWRSDLELEGFGGTDASPAAAPDARVGGRHPAAVGARGPHRCSAYALTRAADVTAQAAAVRAEPNKRAADEAAKASLRAAAAAEGARRAASLAGAARAQANARAHGNAGVAAGEYGGGQYAGGYQFERARRSLLPA